MRKTCLDMVYELAKKDDRIFFIGSDLGAGTMNNFKEEMPGRFFMEGISEANVIGMAAGLAMEGKIPYVNTIATFLTRRCFEQVAVDLCLHNVNVRLMGNGGGMVYAPLGPTHEAIDDIAIFRALPNMTIVAPADADEMRRLMIKSVDYKGPMYIRIAKGYDPIVTLGQIPFEIGKAFQYREGNDALIITTGITLKDGLDASDELEQQGLKVSVLHVPTIKPLDKDKILSCIDQMPIIVTIEEHTVTGGLGGAISEIMAEANFSERKCFQRIGIPDVFPDQYGSQASLKQYFGITAENIITIINKFVQNDDKSQRILSEEVVTYE